MLSACWIITGIELFGEERKCQLRWGGEDEGGDQENLGGKLEWSEATHTRIGNYYFNSNSTFTELF